MGLIKDIYSPDFYNRFAGTLTKVLPAFNKKKFVQQVFDEDFSNKEWKERMKHTTRVLHHFLSPGFSKAVAEIEAIIQQLRADTFGDDMLAFMFFPDYIETYGLDDYKRSMKAFVFITQFISCEFAVRPFIVKYGDKALQEMLGWSKHKSARVRRLSSEGSRPRLPWAMAIPALKKDPSPLLPILEHLKSDPSESVRRSVANNLNDIAKDHPGVVIGIAAKWKGISKETDAVIRHGCRTLLKQGHAEVLKHYGLKSKNIDISNLDIATPSVAVGGTLRFGFDIINNNKSQQTVRMEYGLYYQKSKGHLARKVFKIGERSFRPQETATVQRKQSFKLITTRKFHPGLHRLSIIINGEEKGIRDFKLVE
jgi:3-methyladenine DNA glycosylase AlkC